jgi:hypothetical protein
MTESVLEQITPEVEPEEIPAPVSVVEEVIVTEDKEPEVDVIDVLEPRVENRVVTLTYAGASQNYVQKPLSYFRKMQFFELVGETIDLAIGSGDDGLTVNSLLGSGPTSVSDLAASDFADLDGFLSLASKIMRYAPDFLKDCYLIWLNVPKNERAWAREALDEIDDEEGIAVIETFIDQNWDAIERFFVELVPALARRVQARRQKD